MRGFHGVRHKRRHSDDATWQGIDDVAAHRQSERALEDKDQGVEWRRVLTQGLARIERKKSDLPPAFLASTRLEMPCSAGEMSVSSKRASPGGS